MEPPSNDLRVLFKTPQYEESARLAERMKQATTELKIDPKWIRGSDSFWYRRSVVKGKATFVLVNALIGEQKPAFDHAKLAQKLTDCGIPASRDTFPFKSISLGTNLESVKFCIGEKQWEFHSDGSLQELGGLDETQCLQPMSEEKPSEHSHVKITLTFVNKTVAPISIYWIDWKGEPRHYSEVLPGGVDERPTYEGHVWRVTDAESKTRIASFIAPGDNAMALVKSGMACNNGSAEKCDQASSTHVDPPTQTGPHFYVKTFNVWMRNSQGEETQFSTTGTENAPFDENHIYPSPDGTHVIAWQYGPEQERMVSIVDVQPNDRIQPRLKQYQYLKPGDIVRQDRPRLFEVKSGTEVNTSNSTFSNPFSVTDIGWNLDGSEYRFIYNQRGHQILRVIGINKNGNVRCIIEETSETFIDYSAKTFFHDFEDIDEAIWMSERSGYNHLYLYNLASCKVKQQLTTGDWNVRSVEFVDEDKKLIWLKVIGAVKGQDPYYIDLMRVGMDGTNPEILTCGDGTHEWNWTNRKYLIDFRSRVDLPAQVTVIEVESGRRFTIEDGKLPEAGMGWSIPERFAAPGRDGTTMIYGVIIRPFRLDEGKTYPVIEEIYAGPQGYTVPKSFSLLTAQHELAELGFIVVRIDGMGTNWRNKSFHDHCYKNLHEAGLPDRIAWMRAAAETRPWMDLTRVGIYGSSAGGQSALSAVLRFGDFYKAAMADCGCHDNRLDKLWWNEQWMGWPVDASYEHSSNVVHAHRLQGALLLIVGGLDENVDPASTMQVVHALNQAEKDYELLVFPREGHGAGRNSRYAIRRQHDFFVRHLMQAEPPNRKLAPE